MRAVYYQDERELQDVRLNGFEKEQVVRDWLTLVQAEGIGPVNCKKLLSSYLSPKQVLSADDSQLRVMGLNRRSIQSLREPNIKLIDRAIDWLTKPDHHLITCQDEDYPELLKHIHAPPPILFAIGQRRVLDGFSFAIVGSRNPSQGGRKLAEEFAFELAKSGLCICSGLALGIDYHSHLGALNANCPTIAVLGNGLDVVYPARHKKIAHEITENGLLLSEYFLGTKPTAGNFPKRNRIISGISLGVLVVEAAERSGSLITAHYALEQGRDVFAIPGSIHNPLVKGTHSLIKQGAKLVEKIDDILEDLAPLAGVIMNKHNAGKHDENDSSITNPEHQLLLDSMGYDEISVDELVTFTGLTADAVSSMLSMLELQGMIESRHGGKYYRCS